MTRALSFEDARRRFVNRFTMEHVPAHAAEPTRGGWYLAPQYRSDREWYDRTAFPGEGGVRPRAAHCVSTGRSWPLGERLAAPYRIGLPPIAFSPEVGRPIGPVTVDRYPLVDVEREIP